MDRFSYCGLPRRELKVYGLSILAFNASNRIDIIPEYKIHHFNNMNRTVLKTIRTRSVNRFKGSNALGCSITSRFKLGGEVKSRTGETSSTVTIGERENL